MSEMPELCSTCARWVSVDEWLATNMDNHGVQTVIAEGEPGRYRGAAYHDGLCWRTVDGYHADDQILYVLDGLPEVPE